MFYEEVMFCKREHMMDLKDFEKIIKGPQLQQKERHIDYLKSLPIFQHFPVEKLRVSGSDFYHRYYKKGKVIVSSKENEHIIVIQSGNCHVLCEVTRRRPLSAQQRKKCSELEQHFPCLQHHHRPERRAKSATLMHWEAGEMRRSVRANILTGVTKSDKILNREETKNFATGDTTSKKETLQPSKTYAQLAQLQPGEIFGLESLFQDYPVDIILVSDGAECIFLSRKLFAKESNSRVLQNVSDMLVTYPNEEYIMNKMAEAKQWEAYKKSLLSDIVHRKKAWPHR